MLPERLSTDLTSLVEAEPRAAVVVEMEVAADGAIRGSSVARAMVLNRAKLAYDAVAAWLEGDGTGAVATPNVNGLAASLQLQDRVAQALRQRRQRQGALSLESMQARAVFDGDQLADLQRDRKNRAKALIEDFMIAANGTVARFLADRGLPAIRRMLRTPSRWSRIVEVGREFGGTLPDVPDARALDAFLRERRAADPDRFPDLSLAVVKLLGAGEYAVVVPGEQSDGHFGLAVRDYTHSTAPNRRFPDLFTQRQVKAALAGTDAAVLDAGAAGAGGALHAAGERRRQGRASGKQVGGGAAARRSHRPGLRRHRHRRVRQGDVGARHHAAGRRPRRPRRGGARRRRARARPARRRQRRARLHRLRAGAMRSWQTPRRSRPIRRPTRFRYTVGPRKLRRLSRSQEVRWLRFITRSQSMSAPTQPGLRCARLVTHPGSSRRS